MTKWNVLEINYIWKMTLHSNVVRKTMSKAVTSDH